ncbi:hypothetical protein GAMM_90016 [Gammaproteobacteria bacterium]
MPISKTNKIVMVTLESIIKNLAEGKTVTLWVLATFWLT